MRSLRIALITALPLVAIPRAASAETITTPPAAPAAPAKEQEPPSPPKGSLATMAPLGEGRIGMSIGGGVAVLLPFYAIEAGVGLGRVDIVGRLESVIGVLHYPAIGVRYSPLDIGSWKLGLELTASYSFFGIATDNVNLTSTFYMSALAGISGPVTKATDLVFAVSNEVDFFDYRRLDGEGEVRGNFHYDTAIFILGMKTRLTEDLDGYLRARVRVPVETFRYEATGLYVVPFIEVGGTFSFL